MFMYHLGMVLLIWMGLGLIGGLKALIFDNPSVEEGIENVREHFGVDDDDPILDVLKSKKLYMAYSLLLGPIGTIMDIYGTFRHRDS